MDTADHAANRMLAPPGSPLVADTAGKLIDKKSADQLHRKLSDEIEHDPSWRWTDKLKSRESPRPIHPKRRTAFPVFADRFCLAMLCPYANHSTAKEITGILGDHS
jgi:hypothetical protein